MSRVIIMIWALLKVFSTHSKIIINTLNGMASITDVKSPMKAIRGEEHSRNYDSPTEWLIMITPWIG